MNEPMQNPYPSDAQAQLARERNRVAADRSLLSFTRNSVTLISAGVGIDQIARTFTPNVPLVNVWVYLLTLVLIGLGVANLIFGAADYQREMKRLRQPEYYFTPRWSLGAVTGWIVLFAGLVVFIRINVGLVLKLQFGIE